MSRGVVVLPSLALGLVVLGQVEVLDLTKWVPPSRRGRTVGAVEVTSVERTPPLELTLILPQQTYRLGEEFVFEVAIQNIAGAPFPIPWEPDWRRILPDGVPAQLDQLPEGYRSAALFLNAALGEQEVSLVSFSLDGSEEVPGSIRVLAPGETVRVRAKANWTRLTELTEAALPPVKVSLWAEWAYFFGLRHMLHPSQVNRWQSHVNSEPRVVTLEP